ncbi:putative NAD dependent epimerase/dehydratase [Xylona heveae TC161]|uniref:Putative NAD dependent epimerase/dehydratase n=1 Tax=Xylona heveae (strain CBS 132557 / TC161) TaxID=1328760 RepID=A0A164ZUP1_XYLHT|nr:putative NAD dependent epimerase/dehydratase [Xylona heveae TC161]KZF19552.1 putative NAD dependent epimerase/dehydratase [Xylona heveae TC161]
MAPKRIFITGASGFIGSVVVEQAVKKGYEVHALSRTETSDAKLKAQGAIPVRGGLESYDVLREQSAQADIVLHLADPFARDFTMDYAEVMRIDHAAVDAIGAGLEGSHKPLVIASGSLTAGPTGDVTTEESPPPEKPLNGRLQSEQHALKLANRGVTTSAVRLAPFVYGRGGSGVMHLMAMSAKSGEVFYVDDGSLKTSSVHVDDAAALFLLAAEKAKAGEVFNGTSAHNTTFRELSEAVGSVLQLPVKPLSFEETLTTKGEFLARFLTAENQASGAKAKRVLGWNPEGPSILDDIKTGSYVALAEGLKKGAA